MKAIDLDWLADRGRSRLGWLLLAAGIGCSLFGIERHRSWFVEGERLDALALEQRQSTRRSAARVREPAREQSALLLEVRAANRVVDQLNIPWPELFRDLEAATDRSVSLLAVQPDTSTRSVRLEGEARDYRSVLGFVGRLEGTPAFSTVHVASHQTRVGAPSRAVTFALVASWSADPQ